MMKKNLEINGMNHKIKLDLLTISYTMLIIVVMFVYAKLEILSLC